MTRLVLAACVTVLLIAGAIAGGWLVAAKLAVWGFLAWACTFGVGALVMLVDQHMETQRRASERVLLELKQARWERREAVIRAATAEGKPPPPFTGPIADAERRRSAASDRVVALIVVSLLALAGYLLWRFWAEIGHVQPLDVDRLRQVLPSAR